MPIRSTSTKCRREPSFRGGCNLPRNYSRHGGTQYQRPTPHLLQRHFPKNRPRKILATSVCMADDRSAAKTAVTLLYVCTGRTRVAARNAARSACASTTRSNRVAIYVYALTSASRTKPVNVPTVKGPTERERGRTTTKVVTSSQTTKVPESCPPQHEEEGHQRDHL